MVSISSYDVMSCSLVVYSDMVVLPETIESDGNSKTVTGGATTTENTFNCDSVNLSKGSTGEDVKKLQTILKSKGFYSRQIDGKFGKWTKKGVIKLQNEQGNSPDGVFGPKTCKKLQAGNTNNNTNSGSNRSKTFTIQDFQTTPTISIDMEALSADVTLKTLYTIEKMNYLKQYQKTLFKMMLGNNIFYTHDGFINNIKLSKEDDALFIELNITGYTDFLNTTVNYDKTIKRSEHIKELAKLVGLKAEVDMTGLTDDVIKITSVQENTGSNIGTGGTKTLDEIYSMASEFKYGGIGTQLNPEKAWKAYENGGRTFDCYDCSNFLFYCLKNFAKIPCRIVQGYSPSARSGTHRVVQIKENGVWHCPKQAWNLTRNLRPFTPEDKYALTPLLTWEG